MEAMTRRRVLCVLLLASALLACFAGWLWIRRPHLTRARFEQLKGQIKKGMSSEEVIRTVGVPPGDYSNGRCVPISYRGSVPHEWVCSDGALYVRFDNTETVYDVDVLDVLDRPLPPPTFTERIRRWLGL
jgi:hypothetical protein